MAHFYGMIQGGRGEASRLGHKATGLRACAASHGGSIRVELSHDDSGKDRFRVTQEPWQGTGISQALASGFVGELFMPAAELAAAQGALDRIAAIIREEFPAARDEQPADGLNRIWAILAATGRKL